MKLGQKALEELRNEVGSFLVPGEELLVIGSIALSGVACLLEKKEEVLASFFSAAFLQEARKLRENYCVRKEQMERLESVFYPDAVYEAGEGGILAAIWKLAEASGVGLRLDLRKIPIRQETIEICERLDVNPYRLESRGCVLVGIKNGAAFLNACEREGLPAAVIGETNQASGRLLYSKGNVRYLERPQEDEILRFLSKRQN